MLKRELITNLKLLTIFSIILVAMIIIVGLMYPSIVDTNVDIDAMMEMFPKQLLEAFNMDIVSIKSVFGWIASEGYIFIELLGGTFFAILGGTILLKEKSDHTIDYLYSKPISKNYIVTNKLLCGLIYLLIFNIIIGLSTYIALIINDDLNVKKWLLLTINPLLFDLFIFIISFFISLFFKKTKDGISAGIGLVFVMYLISILSLLTDKLEFLKYFTIFYYVDAKSIVKNSSVSINNVLIILAVSIIIGIMSYYKYNKTELGK